MLSGVHRYTTGMKWVNHVNPFHATGLFWYPLKTSENLCFSDVFRGVSKETSGMKWVNATISQTGSMVSIDLEDAL